MLQGFKKTFESRYTISTVYKNICRNDKELMISYKIAHFIVKCGTTHIYGEI